MTNEEVLLELKRKLTFPNYKDLTIDQYNWLCDRMKEVREYLSSQEIKNIPNKL